jgi:hypothetical protein
MHQPGEVLGRAVGAVGGEPRRPEAEALLGSLNHGSGRADLSLPNGATGLDIDDDGGCPDLGQRDAAIASDDVEDRRTMPLEAMRTSPPSGPGRASP